MQTAVSTGTVAALLFLPVRLLDFVQDYIYLTSSKLDKLNFFIHLNIYFSALQSLLWMYFKLHYLSRSTHSNWPWWFHKSCLESNFACNFSFSTEGLIALPLFVTASHQRAHTETHSTIPISYGPARCGVNKPYILCSQTCVPLPLSTLSCICQIKSV